MKPYETPDVIEIGHTEDVVLGEKISGSDSPNDLFRVESASFLDTDE